MSNESNETVLAEERNGKLMDRCISDALIKTAGGLAIGAIFSILFFKRRVWPAWLGTGFGIGMAYRTCEKDLNEMNNNSSFNN